MSYIPIKIQCPKGYRVMRPGEIYKDGDLMWLGSYSVMYGHVFNEFNSQKRINSDDRVPNKGMSFRRIKRKP